MGQQRPRSDQSGLDTVSATTLPTALDEVVEEFAAVPPKDRLQLLLEYSQDLPELPSEFATHRDLLEQVHECQTPFFVASRVDDAGRVQLFFDAPPEAPTTRGFAGILHAGLSGATVDDVLDVPDDFYVALGLQDAISPLRLRGMTAILRRIKQQLRIGGSTGQDR
jgi:cysteine desulfuration protein SufE